MKDSDSRTVFDDTNLTRVVSKCSRAAQAFRRKPALSGAAGSSSEPHIPITPGLYRHFICPHCQIDDYRYVLHSREGRTSARMSWFKCVGCSVTFNDPERFTRLIHIAHTNRRHQVHAGTASRPRRY